MEGLYEQLKRGRDLAAGDVEGAIRQVIAQGSLFDFDPAAPRPAFEEINLRKRPVRARTAAQDAYIRALRRDALVFGTGPAGTGKTWLAVAHAVSLFERKEVDRIILSRPAVEAGERLGFLPGDMREKVDPYLRPVYDALYDLMDARIVERALQTNEIEIAPLAFMRGRTLSNAAIILDEAQNTTTMQMKMFLTRLGENSRMIVTGDPSQVDLPSGQTSGLAEAVRLLVRRRGHRPRDIQRRGRGAPRAGLAHRRGLRQGDRAQARGANELSPLPDPPPQAGDGRAERLRSTSWSSRRSGRPSRGPPPSCEKPYGAAAIAASTPRAELAIVLTDDSAIHALNRDWRGQDEPTNVLSFPAAHAARAQARAARIARRHRHRLSRPRRAKPSRRQAAQAPSRASCRARLSPPRRLRPRERIATRRGWNRWKLKSSPARRARSLCRAPMPADAMPREARHA